MFLIFILPPESRVELILNRFLQLLIILELFFFSRKYLTLGVSMCLSVEDMVMYVFTFIGRVISIPNEKYK